MMDTPDAQLLDQNIVFSFFLKVEDKVVDDKTLSWWKDRHNQQDIAYQKQDLNYFVHRIDNKIQSLENNQKQMTKQDKILDFGDNMYHVSSIYNAYYDQMLLLSV